MGNIMKTVAMRCKVAALTLLIAYPANADIYRIFWPEENMEDPENPDNTSWQAIKITNISSNTVIDGTLSGVYSQDVSALEALAIADNPGAASYDVELQLSGTGQNPVVLDFTGDTLKFRAEQGIALNPQDVGEGGANTYTYDVVYEVNPLTGELLSTRLIATSEVNADLADRAGFTVDLELSEVERSGTASTFQSYATNVTNETTSETTVNIQTNGGLITEQLSNPDGTSLLRREDDGTVHIGENSIVLADELVSASGNDEIYSSSDVLQLGNDSNHRTIVVGTLEVPTPTANNQAANKLYVDSGDAATLASANSYANGVAALGLAASQIGINVDPRSTLGIGFGLGSVGGSSAYAVGISARPENTQARYSFTLTRSQSIGRTGLAAGVYVSLR